MAPSNSTHVLQEALALPTEERLALATELLNSVEGPEDEQWADAWNVELRRRHEEVQRGDVTLAPWHEVKDRALTNLKSK